MELADLVNAMRFVELSATSRTDAIRELVRAGNWDQQQISEDAVLLAVEDREATAQTIIVPGLALPHATIDWEGDFRLVLGRSRSGVDYGASAVVHLVVLLVVGKGRHQTHLDVLAGIAELLQDDEFRAALVATRDVDGIELLLGEHAGRPRAGHIRLPAEIPPRSEVLVGQAVDLAVSLGAQALLLAVDRCQSVPWMPLMKWSGRLLIITTASNESNTLDRPDTYLFDIPHAGLSRVDRANLGLLLAAAKGVVSHETEVVCVTGPRGRHLDSITLTRPAAHLREMFSGKIQRGASAIPPAVILRILSLAVELASEGREGRPVGAMFVLGDSRQVMARTQQLVLNPFHGFSRQLRNVLDPSLTETIKEFALLDGAFIIQADGTARSAGTYIASESRATDCPGGLGARHQAAASITAETRAMAVTVSQSTGAVTLFQNGGIVLTLERATLTRW